MELAIAQIRIDGETQPRVQIDIATVDEYAEDMATGFPFPPLTVYHDGKAYWLADGFHRYHAAMKAGQTVVQATVMPGTVKDARWHACGANRAHGLRRTNADKRRAVEMALEMHPEKSDRALAEHVGVSDPFVGNVRRQVLTVSTSTPPQSRIGLDGKAYPPVPTQRPSQEAIAEKLALPGLRRMFLEGKLSATLAAAVGAAGYDHQAAYMDALIDAGEDADPLMVWTNLKAPGPRQSTPSRPPQQQTIPGLPAEREVIRDEVGQEVPAEAMGVWNRRQEVQDLLTALSRVRSAVRRCQDSEDVLGKETNYSSLMAHLNQAYADLETMKPYAVCPSCHGLIGCRLCSGRGLVSKFRWDTCVTREQKQLASENAGSGDEEPVPPAATNEPAEAGGLLADADWRNAAKILQVYDVQVLVLDLDNKRVLSVDPEAHEVYVEFEGETKAETEREWKACLQHDGIDLKRCNTLHLDGMMACRKREDGHPVNTWSIYAVGQLHGPKGWSLLGDPERDNAACKFSTEEERDAAWQRLVIDNPNALEG